MEYRIDRAALEDSVARQVALVESHSIPRLLADVVELRHASESVSRGEARALWFGAGLATHVGLAIFEEPERFVTAAPPPVTPSSETFYASACASRHWLAAKGGCRLAL